MTPLKLKFADEAAWLAAQAATLMRDGEPAPGVQTVVLGILSHETGNTITVTGPGGTTMQVPERIPQPGWCVDLLVPDDLDVSALHPYMVNPVQPKHVWAGNLVLAMPEELVEAETTAMVTRGIGQQVPDDVLARIETALLRGRITPEMAADRRARIEARIAITEAREAIGEQRIAREQAVEAARRADAERDRLAALRQAELDKRAAAVAAIGSLTGPARQAEAAKRDAATAMAAELADRIAAQVSALAVARQAAEAAAAEIEAARGRVVEARAGLKD